MITSILDTYDVESTVTDKLYRIGRLLRARANGFFQGKGIPITAEQWGILLRLSEKEGRPQREFASRIFQDYPNVTRLVDRLERRDLVRRVPDPKDRRSRLLYLTSEGKNLVESLLPLVIEEKERFYEGLEEKEIAGLSTMLSRIEENLIKK